MKANQLGWQRLVLQEESQSTEPNEPGLEIREAENREIDGARAMNPNGFQLGERWEKEERNKDGGNADPVGTKGK